MTNKTDDPKPEEKGSESLSQAEMKQNSDGKDSPVDKPIDEHVTALLNILIDQDDTKKTVLNGKEKKVALKKMRKREYDQEMNYESCVALKERFEELLKTKKVSDEDMKAKTYDELCKMLLTQKSLYQERLKFYSAKKSYHESLDDYFQRLVTLASSCQFGDRESLVIADKFITTESNICYAFCNEGQKEIRGKKALKIAKQYYDPKLVSYDFSRFNDFDYPSRKSLFSSSRKGTGNIPPHLAETIRNEIMEANLSVEWDEIAGLEFPKSVFKESIVWPMLRPDIFTGLRKLPKAILLFGPPGTGKTMIAKCIASQSKSTFFYVSASTLASKYHGESEQLVRALFSVAAEHQPAVIFFDEVDSLLTQRSKGDHEVSRRVKTEFMIQLDGATTKEDSRIIFIGATNRPQDLDEAARRRFVKRVYVPLPDLPARKQLLTILLKTHRSNLSDDDVNEIATIANDFSGADIRWLCQDAAMEPLRAIPANRMMNVELKDIRPLEVTDFKTSLKRIRPSVASADLTALVDWDRLYGSNSERPNTDIHFMYT